MQTRTLLTVLIEVENILPDIREINVELDTQIKRIREGDYELEVDSSSVRNLRDLVHELETKFENALPLSLDRNVLARTKTAILVGNEYVVQNVQFRRLALKEQNSVLRDEIFLTAPTTDLTHSNPRAESISSSSSQIPPTRKRRRTGSALFQDPQPQNHDQYRPDSPDYKNTNHSLRK